MRAGQIMSRALLLMSEMHSRSVQDGSMVPARLTGIKSCTQFTTHNIQNPMMADTTNPVSTDTSAVAATNPSRFSTAEIEGFVALARILADIHKRLLALCLPQSQDPSFISL